MPFTFYAIFEAVNNELPVNQAPKHLSSLKQLAVLNGLVSSLFQPSELKHWSRALDLVAKAKTIETKITFWGVENMILQ